MMSIIVYYIVMTILMFFFYLLVFAFLALMISLYCLKAHQSGQDKVQEMYLECFNTVWGIVGAHICKMYPDQKARLQRECRDKILNDNVSR